MAIARPILCPIDLSEQSRQALLWAAAIAQHRSAELVVLSVFEPLLAEAAEIRIGVDLVEQGVELALPEFVETTLPEHVRQAIRVRVHATVGEPAEGILEAAHRLSPSLIVMGTHGLGGLRKLLFGSTTEQVLRKTEWPVLAVPPGAVDPPTAERPGVQLKTILVATDFRDSAMAATQWAGDLALDAGVPLVLAHVVEPVAVPPQWETWVPDFESERLASGQRMLATLSAGFSSVRSDSVVSLGPPADTIASIAIERDAGLVVLGLANAKDSDLRKPGSIAYRVLRLGHVAVVVVPGPAAPAVFDKAS